MYGLCTGPSAEVWLPPDRQKYLAVRLAYDGAAGIENARDDGGVDVGNVALERRGAVHHRHAGQAHVVLEHDTLARQRP